jgi:hypothetical protein
MPLCRMNNDSIRSDYFFLEEVLTQMPRARKIARLEHNHVAGSDDTLIRNDHLQNQKRQHLQNQHHRNDTPINKKSRRLVQQSQRRNITLELLPSFMERHKNNTSWYCGPRDMITWKVEFIFIPTRITQCFQISENQENLLDCIRQQPQQLIPNSNHVTESQESDFKLFLKRLPSPANQPRYIELNNTTACLRTALDGLTIIEHPTIFCVPNMADRLKDFPTGTQLIVEEPNSSCG